MSDDQLHAAEIRTDAEHLASGHICERAERARLREVLAVAARPLDDVLGPPCD